ncbi:hypothetical protein ACN9M0_24840 [Streptomyces sp. R-07]|uniref:hypothetical protein n=1 Tax=Streptomyces sp. R-07 TaxID=3404052 RepID=UPI003CF3D3B6
MRVWIAVWDGSTLICRTIAAWIAGGVAARLVALLLLAGFLKGLPWTTQIAFSAAVAWLATAVIQGLRHPSLPAAEEQPDPPAGEEATDVLPGREDLATALHSIGAPHAHLAVLAEHLGLSPAHTREALTEAGIPIDACRMKGRGSSTGVKAEDFPPLPSPASTPSEAVVAPGQSDNNNGKRVRRWPWGHTVTDPTERLHHAVAKTP